MENKQKIKRRLENSGFWVQSNIDGEDEHLMVGRKNHPGEKAHLTVDGATGEVRIELSESNKQHHELVESIETILTLKTGEKVKSTRTLLEFTENYPRTTSFPILDIMTSLGGRGGPAGHFIHINLINISDQIATDITWGIKGFGYNWKSTDQPFILRSEEEKHLEYKIDGEKPHTEQLKEIFFFSKYSNNLGERFFSSRDLYQQMTPGGLWFEFKVGTFHPATRLKDTHNIIAGEPQRYGDGYKSSFEINENGIVKVITIGICGTFIATWGFMSGYEVKAALDELGTRKIENMLTTGKLEDYFFDTYSFPQDYQVGFEGYKKLRSSI